MKRITPLFYYLLALLLPFGSVNPFSLNSIAGMEEKVEGQMSLTPYLFVICGFLPLLDAKARKQFYDVSSLLAPLIVMLAAFWIGECVYGSFNFTSVFYVKLVFAFFGFVTMSMYFIEYDEILKNVLHVYAFTCFGIILAFFFGLLNGLFFYSNGRLWLLGINPNSFSFLMGFGALVLFWDFIKSKKFNLLPIVELIGTLLILGYILLSGSRGTLLICLLCIGILSFKYIVKSPLISVAFAIVSALILMWFFSVFGTNSNMMERMGDIADMGDRANLLKNAYMLYADHPWFGLGHTGYVTERLSQYHDHRDSHNILMSILVNGGSMALIAYIVYLVRIYKKIGKTIMYDKFPVALFVYVLLISMKTGEVLTFSMMWFAFACCIGLSKMFIVKRQ